MIISAGLLSAIGIIFNGVAMGTTSWILSEGNRKFKLKMIRIFFKKQIKKSIISSGERLRIERVYMGQLWTFRRRKTARRSVRRYFLQFSR